MVELLLLLVIGVALYRRSGRKWEWSRRRLAAAVVGLAEQSVRIVRSARQRLPGVLGQCLQDVGSLGDDLKGLLPPSTRRRIEGHARTALANRSRPRLPRTRSPLAAGGGAQAFQTLQRRYLDGSITLDRYVQEAERLQVPRG